MSSAFFSIVASALLAQAQGAPVRWEAKGGFPMCISKDLWDEMEHAVVSKDEEAFADVQRRGCIIPKVHTHVSVLDSSLFGPWRVRVYSPKGSVEMWVDGAGLQHY